MCGYGKHREESEMKMKDCYSVKTANYLDYDETNGMENKLWYAVLKDREDNDWGYGSWYLDEAVELAYGIDAEIIAVIKLGDDPVCIEELFQGKDF